MGYRSRLFDSYVSSHTSHLYEPTLHVPAGLAKSFKVWFSPYLPANKRTAILDIGCGSGTFLKWLYDKGYTDISGIDLSGEQIELARKRGLKNVKMSGAMDYLAKHKEKFALITAHDLIEHFRKEEVLPFLDAVYAGLVGGGL